MWPCIPLPFGNDCAHTVFVSSMFTLSVTAMDSQPDVHSCMTLLTEGAQYNVRPWQCIPLPFGNDCAHTVFVSSMFTLSVTEADSRTKRHHPLWTNVHISESMSFRTHAHWSFSLFWWVLPPLKVFDTFLTRCILKYQFNASLVLRSTFSESLSSSACRQRYAASPLARRFLATRLRNWRAM